MSDVEELYATIKLEPITPSSSFIDRMLGQAFHVDCDEELYATIKQEPMTPSSSFIDRMLGQAFHVDSDEELYATIKLEPITPSSSFIDRLCGNTFHVDSDEEVYNNNAHTSPWHRDELIIVAAALIFLNEINDTEFYFKFIFYFADDIDEDKDKITFERLQDQIKYFQYNVSLFYELEIEAKYFLGLKFI
jgi:hypothetical protein